jgi:ABC-type transporter Mla subunit MlaD
MAKQDRSALRAGLFIVVTVVLIGGIVVGIKGVRTFVTPVVERKARFALSSDIGGLRIGDDVRLGGYKVGVIRRIEVQGLEEGQQPGILITFTIPTKYALHENAHIAVQTGLTGSSDLNIDNLGSGTELTDAGELTGGADSLTELKASLAKAGPEFTSLLADLHPKVDAVLGKAGNALDHGSEAFAEIGSLFGDTKPDIRGTLANLHAITGSAKAKVPDILEHADAALVKIGNSLDSAQAALQDIQATASNAKDLTGSARAVLLGNRGKLDAMIASLKTTSDNLKGASVEIRRSPWRLLYKPAPGEMDNLTLFDAARQFADGANSVNDAALALRDAMKTPGVDHDQVRKLVEKLNSAFGNFDEVEQKLWKAVKE